MKSDSEDRKTRSGKDSQTEDMLARILRVKFYFTDAAFSVHFNSKKLCDIYS